ncbi:efflux RND transporter permease subunit [Oceanicella actignis]|uniref:efflux RND transporter permease subunit n=1 Tax=Oceanicella actignis TaxID=1189325 RepID=UPI0011E7A64F|nr:efflux RND transporter permease subunit [Oceanicella actignis]TYO91173.1 multidrug efflux pump subunit AcrB [Oceanicella actignis]
MSEGFNLSDWALRRRSFVWYLMAVSMIAGVMSYLNIGRQEDPDFTIKTMVITAALPGATVQETLDQVTDRIEKKLEELDELDFTRSVTWPGRTIVYVNLEPTIRGPAIPRVWQQVRNMMNDIRAEFPPEFAGFGFNDRFGDVFGNLYAFIADGYSPRELKDMAEELRRDIQRLPDAGKVIIFGDRKEVVHLEFAPEKMAALGVTLEQVRATLAAQNAIVPSGVIEAGAQSVLVRVGGQFLDADGLAGVNLRVGDRFFRLTDVATIRRGYEEPPSELFRYNGQEALGLGVGMRKGADILKFGKALDQVVDAARARLPVGVEIVKIADQPASVEEAVGHFTQALFEAVAIVMIVSFISVGLRAGVVVALAVPLVLAITFVFMEHAGFTLQRISLGALIIALGLLVDDAMIAVETMITRLELGESRRAAASYAWRTIAFPMLTGTLITAAGFIPIGLNSSAAGEFTFSLFVVIAVSLLVSWVVAVLFTPVLGVTLLPARWAHDAHKPGLSRRMFRAVLTGAMRMRWLTVALTALAFAASLWGMRFVEQQFFPDSDRRELLVNVTLPQNASIEATSAALARIEAHLKDRDEALFWTAYAGRSAPRFLLPSEPKTPSPNFGQIVIQTPGIEARDRLRTELTALAARELPGADVLVKLLDIGPPVGRPVQYRLSGPDIDKVRDLGRELAAVVATDPRLTALALDWNAPAQVVRLELLQDKARQLGLTAPDVASALATIYDGARMTSLRDGEYLIDVTARGRPEASSSVEALYNLQISLPGGGAAPLSAIAAFRFETEQPMVVQRNRMPTVTVEAAVATDDQPATIVKALAPKIARFAQDLPAGYAVELGGSVEKSAESQAPIAAVAPLMVLIIITLVMVQMQSFRLALIVLSVAPLGLTGVVAALLSAGAPMGFVAILGVLALGGILIRNSIILVDRIEALRAEGLDPWSAVREATESRARPIVLTASAASLALIPISHQVFWGPMAYALMGGIVAGTVITLLFAPALYLIVFRVKAPARGA